MDAAGTAPRVGVDLDDLAEIVTGPGPCLTVYLNTDGSVENAAHRSQQRWHALQARLRAEGAPAAALAHVEPLVPEAHLHGAVLAVIADAHGLRLVEHLGEPLPDDRGTWSRVPDVIPLARWRQDQPSYVVVLADRGGADLIAERVGRRPIEREAGDGDPEHKSAPGGWSQPRYQQRAEDDWAHQAADVSREVTRLCDHVDARLVVLGGDVRAVHLILEGLPREVAARTHLIEHGRAVDGSEAEREEEIQRLVRTAVAEDTVAILDKYREELGQRDRAAAGVAGTVEALNRAAVDVLLVADAADDGRRLWVGAEPIPIGLAEGTDVISGEPTAPALVTGALVRGALGTSASVRVVPSAGPLEEGVGAVLRWAEPAG